MYHDLNWSHLQSGLWIDGQWRNGEQKINDINPATGKIIAEVSVASIEQAEQALSGAKLAFKEWKKSSLEERSRKLKKIADLLMDHKESIAQLLTVEQGKVLAQSRAEIVYAASFFEEYSRAVFSLKDQVIDHPDPVRESVIRSLPIGVVGLITPWNFPVAQAAKKIAAVLAAGCVAVMKPSELTPLVSLIFGPLLQEAEVPDGVLQIIQGEGKTIGAWMTEHVEIKMLSVTGSIETGEAILKGAAKNVKRCSLELGGNAPFILLSEVDIENALDDLISQKLLCSGQVCVAVNRLFIPKTKGEQWLPILIQKLDKIRIGNGLLPGVSMGTLISVQAVQRLKKWVDEAVAEGASIIYENKSFENEVSQDCFYPIQIIVGVNDDMKLFKHEIFGPVLVIYEYETIAEVIDRANSVEQGLAGYVYGKDEVLANEIAEQLECGIVGVNEWRPLRAQVPFGGMKKSGIGYEGGIDGIRELIQLQVISRKNMEGR
jgi:succinate-semialdehyde dehydrogenase/glutarate-semialdehyde dehydrogenase